MDLLAGRIPMTTEAADAPYFVAARLAAAEQSSDPNARMRLLLGAIAERPDDSKIRKALFLSAFEARQYHIALATYRRRGISDDADVDAKLAEAHLQIGEPGEAARMFALAASVERDPARKQALQERQNQARSADERRIEDEKRRPVMRADLDQPNPVKRRLP
jgi:hypothetical protein